MPTSILGSCVVDDDDAEDDDDYDDELFKRLSQLQIKMLASRVRTSKNKNIDHSAQVTSETNHISVLRHSTMSSTVNFCFLCILL